MLEEFTKAKEALSSEDRDVTTAVEAQRLSQEAFPPHVYGNKGAAIYELYRFMARHIRQKPFTQRRARALYNGEVRRFDAEEKDVLLLAQIREARNEQARIRARLAALDQKIAAFDAARIS